MEFNSGFKGLIHQLYQEAAKFDRQNLGSPPSTRTRAIESFQVGLVIPHIPITTAASL